MNRETYLQLRGLVRQGVASVAQAQRLDEYEMNKERTLQEQHDWSRIGRQFQQPGHRR